ncbi:hypothetical protein KA005_47030, partial [bacterium]|nr:hypothetical protein [bacterium]
MRGRFCVKLDEIKGVRNLFCISGNGQGGLDPCLRHAGLRPRRPALRWPDPSAASACGGLRS